MKKLYIVIPVMNLWGQYTKPLLDSLLAADPQETFERHIMVIDNASVDNTKAEMEKLVGPTVEYVRNDQNIGCGAAWNLGIRKSLENSADLVLVLNNDIVVHPKCIANLVERFQTEDNAILATAYNVRENLTVEQMNERTDGDNEEYDQPDFAAFMVDKRLFEIVGEFDEAFFPAYFEDNDMHRRISLADKRAICCHKALFYHYGSRTQNQVSGGIVTSPLFEKNREYFKNKWGGVPETETYKTPFNDPNKTIKSVKQNS